MIYTHCSTNAYIVAATQQSTQRVLTSTSLVSAVA